MHQLSMRWLRVLQAKRLTYKGITAIIFYFTCKNVKCSAQWKHYEMVRGVDDGPKTDWLLDRPLRRLWGCLVCWSKLGILK